MRSAIGQSGQPCPTTSRAPGARSPGSMVTSSDGLAAAAFDSGAERVRPAADEVDSGCDGMTLTAAAGRGAGSDRAGARVEAAWVWFGRDVEVMAAVRAGAWPEILRGCAVGVVDFVVGGGVTTGRTVGAVSASGTAAWASGATERITGLSARTTGANERPTGLAARTTGDKELATGLIVWAIGTIAAFATDHLDHRRHHGGDDLGDRRHQRGRGLRHRRHQRRRRHSPPAPPAERRPSPPAPPAEPRPSPPASRPELPLPPPQQAPSRPSTPPELPPSQPQQAPSRPSTQRELAPLPPSTPLELSPARRGPPPERLPSPPQCQPHQSDPQRPSTPPQRSPAPRWILRGRLRR